MRAITDVNRLINHIQLLISDEIRFIFLMEKYFDFQEKGGEKRIAKRVEMAQDAESEFVSLPTTDTRSWSDIKRKCMN
jgi:hypothetical protein